MQCAEPTKENILIVDDSEFISEFLTEVLLNAGYNARWVNSGFKVFELLETGYNPKLILLDIEMPDINGFEVCKKLKKINAFKTIPIIFITVNDVRKSIFESFQSGGVDYMQKPLNDKEVLIRVKSHIEKQRTIDSLIEISEKLVKEIEEKKSVEKLLRESYDKSFKHGAKLLEINKNLQHEVVERKLVEKKLEKANLELKEEKKKTEIAHETILTEQKIAKQVFDKVIDKGCLHNNDNIEYHMSPIAIFNGDLIFASQPEIDKLHVVLGDFTGHGLPAAIGVIPFAKVFFGMNNKKKSAEIILAEINKELKEVLPINLFCAANYLEVDKKNKSFKIWNGCMPEVLFLNDKLEIKEKFSSQHVPLGILGNKDFDTTFKIYEYDVEDSLLFYTDGVIEARNDNGEHFGLSRFFDLFPMSNDNVLKNITDNIKMFIGNLDQQDDLTLVRVKL